MKTLPATAPPLIANLDTRRFLSRTCLKQIKTITSTAASTNCPVLNWIENTLIPYLLSEEFDEQGSVFLVPPNPEFLPEILRDADNNSKEAYFVTLDREWYNLLYGVVDYLSSVTNSCAVDKESQQPQQLDISVPKAVEDYKQYVAELKASENPEIILSCTDGKYQWVALDTKKLLIVEGYYLHHSGVQHYDELASGRCRFLSLRDKENNSLLTAVYSNSNHLVGVVGYDNRKPDKQYEQNIQELIDYLHLTV